MLYLYNGDKDRENQTKSFVNLLDRVSRLEREAESQMKKAKIVMGWHFSQKDGIRMGVELSY